LAQQGQAHEFWISPERYVVPAGENVLADLRNGEELSGSALSYIPRRTERWDMVIDGAPQPVPSRLGDNPAADIPDVPEGLVVLVHQTAPSRLTYNPKGGRSGWERFQGFAEHKAFDGAIDDHIARGLPEEGITERYHRYAKALVAVGHGIGADKAIGLTTEIVALANPYTDDLSQGLPVQVLHLGAPRPNAQVELFAKASDGTVTITTQRTNAEGIALLDVQPGFEYLADAVVLLPAEDVMWETLWAALTFAVPEG
jgi:uncharacterized GH25 family protein